MRFLYIFIISCLLLSACSQPERPTASADARRYPLKGKVVSTDLVNKKAVIDHEKIPGYMDAMTMPFPVRDADVLAAMTPGAEVKADMVVDKGDYWLENISIVAAANPNGDSALPTKDGFAGEGVDVPDFKLTNQDGKAISFKSFRDRPLAITFIYSRCPLPEYCILMSTRFSDLAKKMESDPNLKNKIRLLSISFDPANDTPETLKKYGLGYLGKEAKYDFVGWQLATAPDKEMREIADFFGLRYEVDQNNKTLFNHSLRTVVITPDGKIKKVFSGGDWTEDELLAQLLPKP